jgi:proteic killer suppression protein
MLNAAAQLSDLLVPPGNRLEALKGKVSGKHSIRVNDQWRMVFRWATGAYEITLTDYH